MRHKTSLTIVVVFALSTLSCGFTGGLGDQQEPETTPQAAPETGFTWDDIPIYPGASRREDTASDTAMQALYETTEARVYETEDGFRQVDAFYLDEMPKHGWSKLQHGCRDEVCLSTWFKGDADIYAQVGISPGEGGGALVGIVRGQGRK